MPIQVGPASLGAGCMDAWEVLVGAGEERERKARTRDWELKDGVCPI